jgi:acetyl-CoA carboxylase carboxyl transferase subunit alpha
MSSSAWRTVELARHPDRPYARDYIERLAPGFVELRGDRLIGDDPALVAGVGRWRDRTTMFFGQQKARTLAERVARNFGMLSPEGYRKCIRLGQQAAKFGFPVLSIVDTPGAYPGAAAEERGMAGAIASAILHWLRLPVPVVAVIVGEGGSGGALGMAVADRVLMLEHAIYSVASPEAAASIVWRDAGQKATAADQLRLTAPDLLGLGLIDGVVREPDGGAHLDWDGAARRVDEAARSAFVELDELGAAELVRARRRRFRSIDRQGCGDALPSAD